MLRMVHELAPEQLRYTFDPKALGFPTTEHLQPLEGIIGQPRAVSALRFELSIQEIGFHIDTRRASGHRQDDRPADVPRRAG